MDKAWHEGELNQKKMAKNILKQGWGGGLPLKNQLMLRGIKSRGGCEEL